MTLSVAGASMLWVGWFGFNAGSALAADGNAGMAMLVTHISAAAGSLAWVSCEWIKHGKPSVLGIVTGMVAGLGTITPASGFVGPLGGLLIGISAGVVCYFATQYIKRSLKIDDSLDVFAVHGLGGIIGTLLIPFLAVEILDGEGIIVEGRSVITQFGVQALGVLASMAWAGIFTFLILKALDLILGKVRVDPLDEIVGLDVAIHGERGYDL
jgi:Amt family ammonium transporter